MTPGPFEIARAISNNVSGARQRFEDAQGIDALLQAYGQGQNVNQLENILQGLSPEGRKEARGVLAQQQNASQQQQERAAKAAALQAQGLDPSLAAVDAPMAKLILENQQKQSARQAAEAQGIDSELLDLPADLRKEALTKLDLGNKKQDIQKTYDKLIELAPNVGFAKSLPIPGTGSYGLPGGIFSSDYRESAAEFNTLQGRIVGAMRELEQKGRLTERQFNYIVDNQLPNPNDSQATIRGKLRAIGETLGLDMSGLEKMGTDKKSGKKVSKKKQLTGIFLT